MYVCWKGEMEVLMDWGEERARGGGGEERARGGGQTEEGGSGSGESERDRDT